MTFLPPGLREPEVALVVEIRGDGVHVRWQNKLASLKDAERRHEIIVKADDSGKPVDGSLLRLKAFAHTMVFKGDPKAAQKQLEKLLAKNPFTGSEVDTALVNVLEKIEEAFKKKKDEALDYARYRLHDAVKQAHELLPHDEVEEICKAALVEAVIKS